MSYNFLRNVFNLDLKRLTSEQARTSKGGFIGEWSMASLWRAVGKEFQRTGTKLESMINWEKPIENAYRSIRIVFNVVTSLRIFFC